MSKVKKKMTEIIGLMKLKLKLNSVQKDQKKSSNKSQAKVINTQIDIYNFKARELKLKKESLIQISSIRQNLQAQSEKAGKEKLKKKIS